MPGPLPDMRDRAFQANPFPAFRQFNDSGPLVRIRLPIIGRVTGVTTFAAVTEFLRDQDRFVRDPKNAGRRGIPGFSWWMPRTLRVLSQNMLGKDGSDHRRLRTLVEKAFTRHSVEGMQPRVVELADELIDEVARTAVDGVIDIHDLLSRRLPLAVICELLGLPEVDRVRFIKWARGLSEVRSAWGIARMIPGIRNVRKYLDERIRMLRDSPQPGLLSALVETEELGDRLSPDELTAMGFLLLFAGHETTTHVITTGLLCLLQHNEQRHRLMGDWGGANAAVDELLRFMTPILMSKPRFATRDMEFCGEALSRGHMLIAILGAANFDPNEFEQPETLDLRRQPNRHVTFGSGPHTCLGLKLARLEAGCAFERLLTRFPNLELADDPGELAWQGRIGMRSLRRLRVKLNG